MRLVLVHGIGHQGLNSNWVIEAWMAALKAVVSPSDFALLKRQEIIAPFYGDVLYVETQGTSASGVEAVPMSVGLAQEDELEFMGFALQEAASALGVSEAQILAANPSDEALEQGFPHDRRVIALASALEGISPFQGRILLRVLSQAFVYLRRPQARKKVDDIVRRAIGDSPCVIVGHSLGSVVTFNLLRETGPQVPFYMTIGSPLAIKAVQSALGRPLRRPDRVHRWLNGADRNDFITLGRILNASTFGPGIENVEDVDNGPESHDSNMYLRNKSLSDALVSAFRV